MKAFANPLTHANHIEILHGLELSSDLDVATDLNTKKKKNLTEFPECFHVDLKVGREYKTLLELLKEKH